MFCDQCKDLLSDYIDGSLELGEQAKIEYHIAECGACRAVRDDLLQIVQFSRKLPLHTPSNSLWVRIKSDIENESKPVLGSGPTLWWRWLQSRIEQPSLHWVTAAAALVCVAMLVFVVETRRNSTQIESAPGSSAIASASPTTASLASANAEEARSDLSDMEQRIRALNDLAVQRSMNWSPDVRSAFNRDMSYVDETLAQCHHDLSDNPHDDVCREMMLNAYREKVRLLEGFTDY